jgi:hypothetical protein
MGISRFLDASRTASAKENPSAQSSTGLGEGLALAEFLTRPQSVDVKSAPPLNQAEAG